MGERKVVFKFDDGSQKEMARGEFIEWRTQAFNKRYREIIYKWVKEEVPEPIKTMVLEKWAKENREGIEGTKLKKA